MEIMIGRNHNAYGEIMSENWVRSGDSWAWLVLHKSPAGG